MTKDKALHAWFNSFGVKMYPVNALPVEPTFPYGTYTYGYEGFGETYYSTVNLYYLTQSTVTINAKADEIISAIKDGGIQIPCDNGSLWIRRGTCQAINDPDNSNIQRRYMQIAIENLTD